MRVLVVGAGIIGSIYGWALAESGHHVVHLVRSGRASGLHDGLTLDMLDRRKGHKRNFRLLYRLHAVETLSRTDTFELVIVPVNTMRWWKPSRKSFPERGLRSSCY
jgi:2-dehydropantoate 2-reductase